MFHCWCGNENLTVFNSQYQLCENCFTIVSTIHSQQQNTKFVESFYKKDYWYEYQKNVHGFPNLVERARYDIIERCLYWLKNVLRFKLPSANVLEIGSSHGAFLKLLKDCGYDVLGNELDKEISEFSDVAFGIKTLHGPIENINLKPHSFDIIMMFDVLEHLENPITTIKKCFELLAPEGILVIQTPEYKTGRTYEELINNKDPFLKMLVPEEHLYLFSTIAIDELFKKIISEKYYINYIDSFFPYDMFFICSRRPFIENSSEKINECLEHSPSSRIIRALLDLGRERDRYIKLYQQADHDRNSRLELLNTINKRSELLNTTKREDGLRSIKVVIDLTPLLPGGHNGGAKIMTVELIKNMAKLSPQNEFILLCTEKNIDEVRLLVGDNIKMFQVTLPAQNYSGKNVWNAMKSKIYQILKNKLPQKLKIRIKSLRIKINKVKVKYKFEKQFDADVLFCPFTSPYFGCLGLPVVSVIYDLQFAYYPFFFTEGERAERYYTFKHVCEVSKKIVCISEYVKKTILEQGKKELDLNVVYIGLPNRLIGDNTDKLTTLQNLRLIKNQYLLYPANFWAHKNHMMLFIAFNIYREETKDYSLKLVCTGDQSDYKKSLEQIVKGMGLEDYILFPGFLGKEDFSVLMNECKAVIFPSLYEGFGMPIVEAMQAGKFVLCSNVTSLPEVAGRAAITFDPKKPLEIVKAMKEINSSIFCESMYMKEGRNRVNEIGDEFKMAANYLEILRNAAHA